MQKVEKEEEKRRGVLLLNEFLFNLGILYSPNNILHVEINI